MPALKKDVTNPFVKTLILTTSLGLLLFTGCKKCYTCSYVYAEFKCSSGMDTIHCFGINYSVSDTLEKYNTLGYTCDTLQISLIPEGNNVSICGETAVDSYENRGDRCSPATTN